MLVFKEMIIFLRNIPVNTRYKDITNFIEPALKGGLFSRPGKITKVEILPMKDIRFKSEEFHALVTVEPDSAGYRALKILKGKRFKDKLILVRQFIHRNWRNDMRQNHQPLPLGVPDKRLFDRRRGKRLERIQEYSLRISNPGDFSRTR